MESASLTVKAAAPATASHQDMANAIRSRLLRDDTLRRMLPPRPRPSEIPPAHD